MKYRLLPAAEADLDSIAIYIGERNPPAAVRLLENFKRRWELLATQPYSGRAREDLAPNQRRLVMKSYIAFYRVEPDAVVIVRVLHGSQDQFPEQFDL